MSANVLQRHHRAGFELDAQPVCLEAQPAGQKKNEQAVLESHVRHVYSLAAGRKTCWTVAVYKVVEVALVVRSARSARRWAMSVTLGKSAVVVLTTTD